jgi:hypothetical protein
MWVAALARAPCRGFPMGGLQLVTRIRVPDSAVCVQLWKQTHDQLKLHAAARVNARRKVLGRVDLRY